MFERLEKIKAATEEIKEKIKEANTNPTDVQDDVSDSSYARSR